MELVGAIGVSIVAIVVMTLLSGGVLSKLHDEPSSFDRFFPETHVSAAAVSTLGTGGLLSYFFHFSFPVVAGVALLTVLSWCAVRLLARRPGQMMMWDKVDVRRLALCLVASVLATYVLSFLVGIAPGLEPLGVGIIFAACWVLNFPL